MINNVSIGHSTDPDVFSYADDWHLLLQNHPENKTDIVHLRKLSFNRYRNTFAANAVIFLKVSIQKKHANTNTSKEVFG